MSTVEERQRARDRAADAVALPAECKVIGSNSNGSTWPERLVGGSAAARKRRWRAQRKAQGLPT